MPVARCRTLCIALLAALTLAMSAVRAQPADANLLLFEVRMEEYLVAEAMTAYQVDGRIYFPLGELARMIGVGIHTDPGQGTASGFILDETRRFSLNSRNLSYALDGQTGTVDEDDILLLEDDIYVSSALLTRWLPLEMDIELPRLLLQLHALQPFPLHMRLQRERRAAQLAREGEGEQTGLPRAPLPYRLFDLPFLDQTFSFDARRNDQASETAGTYTVFATGDLLGMEASLYFSRHSDQSSPRPRLTLARHDPDSGLLGPLRARSLELGSVVMPDISHIALASEPGYGMRVSNRPLINPLNFNRHTVQGNLPPGWDVELYFNDALMGLQRADAEGRYRFDDLPLIFGVNEFRLVFYGPLGQVHVERQRILLEPSIVRPGEFFYNLAEQQDELGRRRASLQFDAGLGSHLIASGGVASLPFEDGQRNYANLGLRRFWNSFVFSGDFAASDDGGRLAELGFHTRIGNMGVQFSRVQLDDFVSELFAPANERVRSRNLLRLDGSLAALPRVALALEARQDQWQSGGQQRDVSLRLSGAVRNTAVSHTLRWLKTGEQEETNGLLQFSRRVADIGITGHLGYRLRPQADMMDALIMADKPLGRGYRLNLGAARLYPARDMQYLVGLTKGLGRYGLRVNASHTSAGESALGVQLFVALGREPRRQQWLPDAQPIAHTGAASMQVFLDHNQNGVKDEGDEAIPGAGFTVRGSNYPVRTDAQGIALISRLPPRRHVDIELDIATLEDPQWTAQKSGTRLLPRPGRVAEIELPVILTAEIEGMVYLAEAGGQRGIGDAVIELVNGKGEIVAQTRSAVDGLYVMPAVPPGEYQLRVSPEQLERLNVVSNPPHRVSVTRDGAYLGERDFVLRAADQAPPTPPAEDAPA